MTKTSTHMPTCHMPTWLALLLTLAMVVLFLLLMAWRVWRGFAGGLPTWLTTASSLLLMESGFALITKENP